MAEWVYDAPGKNEDFRDPNVWHQEMSDSARGIVLTLLSIALDKPLSQITQAEANATVPKLGYANPAFEEVPANADTVAVQPWNGFPRAVERRLWPQYPPTDADADGTYRAVEAVGDEDHGDGVFIDRHDSVLHLPIRHRQDEYLEWVGRRDDEGKLASITFVAEGYDYFSTLFRHDEQRVLELYKEFTGVESLKVDDLRAKDGIYRRYSDGSIGTIVEPGGFNIRNRFNIDPGIVHLSHRANSLGAEINLAGVSAILRAKADGSTLDGGDKEELLCCNRGGDANRHSDPSISQQAYALVKQGLRYTLANPVGLYIAGVMDGLLLPDNRTPVPQEWWHVERGYDLWAPQQSRVLRMTLRPPEGESIKVGDLIASGAPLVYPGQVAKLINVHLFVTAWARPGGGTGPIAKCKGTCCVDANEFLTPWQDGCREGSQLAFPGLIAGAPAMPLALASAAPHSFR